MRQSRAILGHCCPPRPRQHGTKRRFPGHEAHLLHSICSQASHSTICQMHDEQHGRTNRFLEAWRAARARSVKAHPLQLSPQSVGYHGEIYGLLGYCGAAPRTMRIRASRHPGLRLGDVLQNVNAHLTTVSSPIGNKRGRSLVCFACASNLCLSGSAALITIGPPPARQSTHHRLPILRFWERKLHVLRAFGLRLERLCQNSVPVFFNTIWQRHIRGKALALLASRASSRQLNEIIALHQRHRAQRVSKANTPSTCRTYR